jgi:hypothetical protein
MPGRSKYERRRDAAHLRQQMAEAVLTCRCAHGTCETCRAAAEALSGDDISEAEIERRYQAALADVRQRNQQEARQSCP